MILPALLRRSRVLHRYVLWEDYCRRAYCPLQGASAAARQSTPGLAGLRYAVCGDHRDFDDHATISCSPIGSHRDFPSPPSACVSAVPHPGYVDSVPWPFSFWLASWSFFDRRRDCLPIDAAPCDAGYAAGFGSDRSCHFACAAWIAICF